MGRGRKTWHTNKDTTAVPEGRAARARCHVKLQMCPGGVCRGLLELLGAVAIPGPDLHLQILDLVAEVARARRALGDLAELFLVVHVGSMVQHYGASMLLSELRQ